MTTYWLQLLLLLLFLPISVWGDTGSLLRGVSTPIFVLSLNSPVTLRGSCSQETGNLNVIQKIPRLDNDLFKMTVSGVLEGWRGQTEGLADMTGVAVVLTPHHHTVAVVTLQGPHHKLPV